MVMKQSTSCNVVDKSIGVYPPKIFGIMMWCMTSGRIFNPKKAKLKFNWSSMLTCQDPTCFQFSKCVNPPPYGIFLCHVKRLPCEGALCLTEYSRVIEIFFFFRKALNPCGFAGKTQLRSYRNAKNFRVNFTCKYWDNTTIYLYASHSWLIFVCKSPASKQTL